jgi:predicted DNA-binding protein
MSTPHDQTLSFRLPRSLYDRIEDLRAKMTKRTVGVSVDRAGVLRMLLERGLESAEKDLA